MSAQRTPADDGIDTCHSSEGTPRMQPLAAYYVFVANEEARNASTRRPYRSAPPKHTGRFRVSAAVAALVRPIRRTAATPA
jgi:hypothetical protein